MAELIPILETAPAGYRSNAAGHLVPEAKIDDIDKDRDELVRGFIARAQALHLSLSRFKRDALGDVDAFVSLVAEKYGASVGGAKGNVTLMSYDGRFKLQVQVAERLEFDERLQVAKTLVDKCIHRWAETADDNLKALVDHAFQTDKKGKINLGRVLSLTRLKIDDEEWQQAMQAIRDSMQVASSTRYVRVYQRVGDGDQYQPIALDMAAISLGGA